jgi:hypothetical protein
MKVISREIKLSGKGRGYASLGIYLGEAMVMGYIAHVIHSILNNKEPTSFLSADGVRSTLKRSGVLGMFGDALIGEYYAQDHSIPGNTLKSLGSYLTGPVGGVGGRIHDAMDEIVNSGKTEFVESPDSQYGGYARQKKASRGKRMLFQTMIDNAPYLDFPLIGLALDTFVFSNMADAIDKGYEARRDTALRRHGSRTLWDVDF